MSSPTPCPIAQHAQQTPTASALISGKQRLTYAEVDAKITGITTALRHNGIQYGQTVALVLPLSADYVLLVWALLRMGAIPCPLNPRFPQVFLVERLENISPDFLISNLEIETGIPCIAPEKLHEYKETLQNPGDAGLDPGRTATLILTSGSGGAPKAAAHTLGSHFACAASSNANIPLHPGDCWLLSLPLYHISGMATLFRCFLAGASVGIPEHRGALRQVLETLPVTHLSLVAAQLQELMGDAQTLARLRECKAILLGGAAIPEPLIKRAVDAGLPIHTTYGLTEMASQVCTTPPDAGLAVLLTSGKPLAPDSIKVDGDGTILVGGDALFQGYWYKGTIQPPPLHAGFFATGDLGRFDAQGHLHVLGRRDNMFSSGGENIQPEEVEKALLECKGVFKAICVPVPDGRLEWMSAVFVGMEGGMGADALLAELQNRLPKFALPRHIFAWPEDLCGDGIKVNRRAFQERAAQLAGQDTLTTRPQKY